MSLCCRTGGAGGTIEADRGHRTGLVSRASCGFCKPGAAWRFLPDEFPSPSTCWRRLKQWEEEGVWLDAWRALLGALDEDASAQVGRDLLGRQLRPGEKGGAAVGKTKRGKGTKWMVLVDGQGLPLGVRLESASPAEVKLAEATLAEVRVPRPKGRPRQKPERVIADRGYDSDPLRERLKKRGIELIVPYRKNNKERRYEDGRKLRRYKRRWIVERTNAWLGQFRRLLVRHEHLLSTYSRLLLPRLLLDYASEIFLKHALGTSVDAGTAL